MSGNGKRQFDDDGPPVSGTRQLEIISQILTWQLQRKDVDKILRLLAETGSGDYLESIEEIFGHVSSLLRISSRLLDNLLLMMVEISTRLIGAERGTLFLIDSENLELFSRVAQGEGESSVEIRCPLDQGIVGSVVGTGKTVFIADAYADARFNKDIDKVTGYVTKNLLCLPLRSEPNGGIIGALELLNIRSGQVPHRELELLEKVCLQAGQALQGAQMFEEVRQARENESHLLEVASVISSELQLKPLLEKIMEAITTILACDRSTLFLHDEKARELWSQVAQGLGSHQEIRFPDSMGIAGKVFQSRDTVNIPDAYRDPRFNPEVDRKTGYRTRNILTMPIVNKSGKAIGVSQVLNKQGGPFTRNDERKLRIFSTQASIAIENAKLFDDVLNMKNYSESVLQSLSNGVISVNAMRRIETVNAVAMRILGVEREDIVGRFADIYFVRENHWIVDSLRRVVATNDPDMFYDVELVNPKGKKVAVNVAIVPLRDTQHQPMGGLIVLEDLTTEKRLKGTLARYMTKEVADQLMESEEASLGGQIKELTILFSDIRDFTTISEDLGPQETVAMLNEYFTGMVDIIFHHGGILDKFIGDAMLGVFGAPFSTGEDADRGVAAAVEMCKSLRTFNATRRAQGKREISIGVGINTDKVLVGNIGSMKRMDYTVIGDGVNLASRLEGANKYYGTGILISDQTYQQLKYRYRTREVDLITVKGKTHPVRIHEVLDHFDREAFPNLDEATVSFSAGLVHYRAQAWDAARTAFARALDLHPGDVLTKLYLERCRQFQTAPPGPDWDGVWIMTTK